MAEIQGEAPETVSTDGLEPQLGYSPHGMGSETTEIMQINASLPNTDTVERWDTEQGNAPSEELKRYDTIQTLSVYTSDLNRKMKMCTVTDLGSSDTTYVDDERLETQERVQPGTTLKCGKVSLKVVNIK